MLSIKIRIEVVYIRKDLLLVIMNDIVKLLLRFLVFINIYNFHLAEKISSMKNGRFSGGLAAHSLNLGWRDSQPRMSYANSMGTLNQPCSANS